MLGFTSVFQIHRSTCSVLHLCLKSTGSNAWFHICVITNRFMCIYKQLLCGESPLRIQVSSRAFKFLFETVLTWGVANVIIGWGTCQSKSFRFDCQVPQPIRGVCSANRSISTSSTHIAYICCFLNLFSPRPVVGCCCCISPGLLCLTLCRCR